MNTENHYQETDLGNIAPNPRGEYRPEEAYEYLDLVVFEGGSYVCLAENGTTITGISPESGKTTQYWQVITIPGSLTPEYIAMHDRVANLSEQVEADAEEVRSAEQNVSGMEENVTQMQEQTMQSAEAAERSKDSAAGYASSADASRQAAEESEQNINAHITGFDIHVAEKTEEAENDIEAARIASNKAIIAQQEQSVNEVARAGIEAVSAAQAAAQTATEKAQAASTSEKNAVASEKAAKLSEENATKMAEQVAADKEQVANDRTAVENAKQEMAESAAQIEKNAQGISELKSDIIDLKDEKITKFYTNNLGETHIIDSDNGKIQDMKVFGKSSQDVVPTIENPVEIKGVVNPTVKVTNEDSVNAQSFTVNGVTLCAVPVKEGGNITVNGQRYIADYIDVENGKVVKYVKKLFLKQCQWSKAINKGVIRFYASTRDAVGIGGNKIIKNAYSISSHFAFVTSTPDRIGTFTANADGTNANIGFAFSTDTTTTSDDFNNWILNNKPFVLLPVLKEELPLTSEQIHALKELSTYYPVTNISINSKQLDGYTLFNYPISMENGWNYVKQQIGDTRDYIYDMDARTQDTDLQSAEAYVNSEYAVALAELEV